MHCCDCTALGPAWDACDPISFSATFTCYISSGLDHALGGLTGDLSTFWDMPVSLCDGDWDQQFVVITCYWFVTTTTELGAALIYLTGDNSNLPFLSWYEHPTGEWGNLIPFTPELLVWWLRVQLFDWGWPSVLAVSTHQHWGEVRCAPFLDYRGIVLPLGGEEKQGWKCSLLGPGDAPANPVASSTPQQRAWGCPSLAPLCWARCALRTQVQMLPAVWKC